MIGAVLFHYSMVCAKIKTNGSVREQNDTTSRGNVQPNRDDTEQLLPMPMAYDL
jgi:hypothetical protein